MITKNDVLQAMRSVDPSTTEAQAIRLFETIDRALDDRIQQLDHQMRSRFYDETGKQPNSLVSERILDRVSLDAENQIRAEFLDELTAQAGEQDRQVEEEQLELQQEMLKQSPDAWKTQWPEMDVSIQMLDLTVDLWPDEAETPGTENFYQMAAALLTAMDYQGKIIPTSPDDKDLPALQQQVHEAMKDPASRP